MKKIIILFLLALFIPITKVDGYYCSYVEIAKLKKIAYNINVSYDYVEKNNSINFNMTLVNLNEKLYIIDKVTNKKYNYKKDEMTLSNYKPGTTVQYQIYASNSRCIDELLYTIRIVLPSYNEYYQDKSCKGIEDYSLCNKWAAHNFSQKQFRQKIEDYKRSLIQDKEPPVEPNNDSSLIHIFIGLLVEYYYIVLIVLIILSSFGIYHLNKKSDIYN